MCSVSEMRFPLIETSSIFCSSFQVCYPVSHLDVSPSIFGNFMAIQKNRKSKLYF